MSNKKVKNNFFITYLLLNSYTLHYYDVTDNITHHDENMRGQGARYRDKRCKQKDRYAGKDYPEEKPSDMIGNNQVAEERLEQADIGFKKRQLGYPHEIGRHGGKKLRHFIAGDTFRYHREYGQRTDMQKVHRRKNQRGHYREYRDYVDKGQVVFF